MEGPQEGRGYRIPEDYSMYYKVRTPGRSWSEYLELPKPPAQYSGHPHALKVILRCDWVPAAILHGLNHLQLRWEASCGCLP